jgi:hypothetical protein
MHLSAFRFPSVLVGRRERSKAHADDVSAMDRVGTALRASAHPTKWHGKARARMRRENDIACIAEVDLGKRSHDEDQTWYPKISQPVRLST